MGYRLIALDLDGTALDQTKRVRPETRRAVERAREKGIRTILATGRHHRMAAPYHEQLGLDTPLIACNGACVFDPTTGTTLMERPLDRERSEAILSIVRRHDVFCHIYTSEAVLYDRGDDALVAYIGSLDDDPTRLLMKGFRRVPSFEEVIAGGSGVLKFVLFNPNRAPVEACLAEVERLEGLSREWSWAIGVDVAREGNTKGRTLIDWAASQGIAPGEIVAFGDNHNDISMITAVGLGVAMGNAEPEVRAAARLVTSANDTDGIAEVLRRHVL